VPFTAALSWACIQEAGGFLVTSLLMAEKKLLY